MIISIDQSVLLGVLNARIATSLAQTAPAQTAPARSSASSSQTSPPWRQEGSDPANLARKILAGNPVLQPRPDTSDTGKIYSAYDAVTRLHALTLAVSNKEIPEAFLPQAQRKFTDGLQALQEFINASPLEKVILLPAEKLSSASSQVAITRASYRHVTPTVHTGSPDEAVDSFASATGFRIDIQRNSDTISVDIDLGPLAPESRSIRAVAALIDTALDDAGVSTGLEAVKTGPPDQYGYPTGNTWGFAINGVQSEKISFVATGSTGPGLILAGVSGKGSDRSGQLSLWHTLEDNTPTSAFVNQYEADSGTLEIVRTAVSNDGGIYTLAHTNGPLDGQSPRDERDLVLIRSDSTGKRIWSRFLGSNGTVEGTALAVADDGRVAIGGTVTEKLDASAIGGGRDGFIVVYDSLGRETLVRQRGVPGDDAVTALAFGDGGQLHIGGRTATPLDGSDGAGGTSDAYIETLDTDGSRSWIRHIGTAGRDQITALTTDDSGAVVAASDEDGSIVLRRYASGEDNELDWSHTLGPGHADAVVVDESAVYVSGHTWSGTRTDGVFDAPDLSASDGFALRIDLNRELVEVAPGEPDAAESPAEADSAGSSPAEPDGTADESGDSVPAPALEPTGPVISSQTWFHRLGNDGSQNAPAIGVSGGQVYVAGTIQTDNSESSQSYLKALNADDGTQIWQQRVSGQNTVSRASDLAIDTNSDSDLARLGLPQGTVVSGDTERITDRTSARPGDHFFISVNGGRKSKIVIQRGDSYRDLTFRINAATVLDATAKVVTSSGQRRLTITPARSSNIELFAGRGGRDALSALGLPQGRIYGSIANSGDESSAGPDIVALELRLDADVSEGKTLDMLNTALRRLRTAHRSATENPALEQLNAAPDTSGPVPAWLQQQLSNYQAGLLRLQSSAAGGSSPLAGLLV